MSYKVKQVIVIRKDLKCRRGKEVVQGSHASQAWLLDRLSGMWDNKVDETDFCEEELTWMEQGTPKICLQVDSEEELLDLAEKARAAGIRNVHVVTDRGYTEFNGVPTRTCLAIGPNLSEKLDPITSHLKLY